MSTIQLEIYSVAEFKDLPDGVCLVDPMGRCLRVINNQLDRKRHYRDVDRLIGHYIKIGRYGFRDGSHGEDIIRFRNEKEVITGPKIHPKLKSHQPSREMLLLKRMFALPPLEITPPLLAGSPYSGKPGAERLRDDLARLKQRGLVYRSDVTYRLTGEGVRMALSYDFTPYHSN